MVYGDYLPHAPWDAIYQTELSVLLRENSVLGMVPHTIQIYTEHYIMAQNAYAFVHGALREGVDAYMCFWCVGHLKRDRRLER